MKALYCICISLLTLFSVDFSYAQEVKDTVRVVADTAQVSKNAPKKKTGTVAATKLLEETVVVAVVPQMKVDGDTVTYKADTYGATPDATAEDLLKLLPGMEVDADGNIKANGEEVKKVYVDGKEFFGNNPTTATRNLTADMIDDVQVVDMKTEEARMTGIDDGERQKVINFKLKPKMRHSWFGNVNAGWGEGAGIEDRYDSRVSVGQFYGDTQNMLTGTLGNLRNPGTLPTWNVGLNSNHDKSNRLRDWNTPFAIGGDVSFGGNGNEGYNKSHRINFLKDGNTINDSENNSRNKGRNGRAGFKFEKSWGTLEEGMHRLQINPTIGLSESENESSGIEHKAREEADGDIADISHTERSNNSNSKNFDWAFNSTYSYFKQTEYGRRRTSITLNVSGNTSESDSYTNSGTHYYATDQTAERDTLINQWQDENGSSQTYRVRLTHAQPLPFEKQQSLEFSAQASLTNRYSKQIYYFWDDAFNCWSDTIDGKSNDDYNSDTYTQNINYNVSAHYRIIDGNYNLRVGMELLPQSQSFTDYFDHDRDYHRTYINYSPRAEYTYTWSKHRQLRMTLNGRTQQPNANQLMARKNQTSATSVRLGNKDLDPSYSMNYDARFRNFNEENSHSFEINVRAGASFNNLASKRWYSNDLRVDTTMTVNMKGLGSWNASADFRGTYPFANNLWQFTTYTNLSYNERQGYANQRSSDVEINRSTTTNLRQQLGLGYRQSKLQVDLNGNYNLEYTQASIMTSGNMGATHNFGGSLRINAHLPWDLVFNTDFNYSGRRGFSSGLARNQSIWNAQISRLFLEKKNLSAYFKIFDILQQRSSFNRNISDTSMSDTETRVLGEYFLIGFNFRFNTRPGQNRGGRGGDRGNFQAPEGGMPGGGFGGGGFGGGRRF